MISNGRGVIGEPDKSFVLERRVEATTHRLDCVRYSPGGISERIRANAGATFAAQSGQTAPPGIATAHGRAASMASRALHSGHREFRALDACMILARVSMVIVSSWGFG